jgi:hypothetical protein
MKNTIHIIVSALLLAVSVHAQDSVPKLVNYQGKLTNAAGEPLSNGTYQVKFELFNKPSEQTGDTRIWGRQYGVVVVGGQFNVVLGAAGGTEITPSSVNDIAFAFTDPERYLQMTVVSGPGITTPQTLSPRQQILSTPFALQAETAKTATLFDGQPPAYYAPPGTIVAYASTNAPAGWLVCDGQPWSRTQYANLFGVIGTTFGAGDGSTTFNVPNLQGRFLRGLNGNSGLDPGRANFSVQTDNLPVHRHKWGRTNGSDVYDRALFTYRLNGTEIQISRHYRDVNQAVSYGNLNEDYKGFEPADTNFYTAPGDTVRETGEVRPVNVNMNFIIKY